MDDILISLNPKQKEAVTTIDGPVLVVAGPGSGKTRCLTYRIAYLHSEKQIPFGNMLAVTFTNKAAKEMKERVGRLIQDTNISALTELSRLDAVQGRAEERNKPYLGNTALSTAGPDAEMRQTQKFLPNDQLSIGTFHATCLRILKIDIDKLPDKAYSKNFTIYDENDQLSLLKKIIKGLNVSTEQFKPSTVQSMISRAKDEMLTPAAFKEEAQEYYARVVSQAYDKYQEALEKANALDFDDIIMLTVKLFETKSEVLNKYQDRWQYLMVDEAHDINASQYRLVKLLAEKHKNLWLIADADQSIYSWRGADLRHILSFDRDYPKAKVICLEENYRSSKNIVEASQKIINKNSRRLNGVLGVQFKTSNPDGQPIKIVQAASETYEAAYVVEEMENLMRGEGMEFKDFAVLYRTNAQSRSIEEGLLKAGVPYKIVGTVRFYERKEIKDILAYLRYINNPDDTASLQRIINVPTRRLSKYAKNIELVAQERQTNKALIAFLDAMEEIRRSAKSGNLTQLIKILIKKVDYEAYTKAKSDNEEEAERRLENIRELFSVASVYDDLKIEEGLGNFINDISLMSGSDEVETNKNVVNLMTIHCAKGLEFPVVFIVGCEEGVFPHSRSMMLPDQLEEERRLCYVAITRAKQRAYLTFTSFRRLWGQSMSNAPSRFIGDIPEHLISFEDYS